MWTPVFELLVIVCVGSFALQLNNLTKWQSSSTVWCCSRCLFHWQKETQGRYYSCKTKCSRSNWLLTYLGDFTVYGWTEETGPMLVGLRVIHEHTLLTKRLGYLTTRCHLKCSKTFKVNLIRPFKSCKCTNCSPFSTFINFCSPSRRLTTKITSVWHL